ncbi:MAG: 3-dehydroquinate synthase II [Euryarchaeota archaeon]
MAEKEIWVSIAHEGSWEEKKPFVTEALEAGADVIVCLPEEVEKVKELGNIKVAVPLAAEGGSPDLALDELEDVDADLVIVGVRGEGDGTIDLPEDVQESVDAELLRRARDQGYEVAEYVEIRDKPYERFAAEIARELEPEYLITIGRDWKIIPLENLIAELQDEPTRLIAGARDAEEAKIAFETLEVGADGVLLDAQRIEPGEIKKTAEVAEEVTAERFELVPVEIKEIEPIGKGDRVCVDTCTLMEEGEGMLVGSTAHGMFLIHSESLDNPYVEPRPFRVNAGPVHAYIRVPGGRTKYLAELEPGDEVLVVDREGNARTAIVGRLKIEKRPLLLIKAEYEGIELQTIVQNAETIHLVREDGEPVSVVDLKPGDKVLAYVETDERKGRHFGMEVEETIIEK